MKIRRVMAVIMMCASLCACAQAKSDDSFVKDGVRYTVTGEGTVGASKISDKNTPEGKFVLPSTVTHGDVTYRVTAISHWGFFGCDKMTELVIPESVETIGMFAFTSSKSLTKAVVKCSRAKIDAAIFSGCENLTEVQFAEGVTSIGERALEETGITAVKLPSTLKRIDGSMFTRCAKLRRIEIPEGVEEIGSYAFSCCDSLVDVKLPSTLKRISHNAFSSCAGLKDIKLPEGLATIGDNAFCACKGLTRLHFPSTLEEIQGNPFQYCSNLTELTMEAGGRNFRLDRGVFLNGDGTKLLFALPSLNLGDYVVPEGVESINGSAFYGNNSLTSVKLPRSLKWIGSAAFHDCHNLKTVELNEGLEEIGDKTFYSCGSIVSVTIPGSVVRLGQNAFDFCSGLREVNVCEALAADNQNFNQWTFGFCDSSLRIKIHDANGKVTEKKVDDLYDPKQHMFHEDVHP